jgi:sigma-B regulation protein RsbU (phosphoserine phosphatase)
MSPQQAGIVTIILGTIVLFMGVAACFVAIIRRDSAAKVLAWFGIFSALYGLRLFAAVPPAFNLLAGDLSRYDLSIVWAITYVILIPAVLFWVELSFGLLRRFLQAVAILATLVSVAGMVAIFALRTPARFIGFNNILAIGLLLVLAVVTLVPRLGKKYLAIQSSISAAGTLILAVAVLQENARTFFPMPHYQFFEPVAFTLFVFSQGWVAAEKVFRDQRRLLSIESELAIAREIQNSILPSEVPTLNRLRISATYIPMTAVAGDFYWFIVVDPHRVGLLVADVSGHGVPAALIASMIKIAMQSVVSCASDPGAVLSGLERALSGQLRGQFVSAAYLWIDSENHKALYSAAGHPPFTHVSSGGIEQIESNGLILGVIGGVNYPVREVRVTKGDRFVLYTDGLIEPENAKGEAFGDRRLEQVLISNQHRSGSELSDALIREVRAWQPAGVQQQDDITLIVVDVL